MGKLVNTDKLGAVFVIPDKLDNVFAVVADTEDFQQLVIDDSSFALSFEEGKEHFLEFIDLKDASFIIDALIQLMSKVVQDAIIQAKGIHVLDDFSSGVRSFVVYD